MMLRMLDRISDQERTNILKQAGHYLEHIEDL